MINEVYNTVQEQLNKNGRGILSPARFNLFAENSQLKLLENAIHDYRRSKIRNERYTGDFSLTVLEDVMDKFSLSATLTRYDGVSAINDYHTLPSDYMAWGSASVDNVNIEKIPSRKKAAINRNRYLVPTTEEPICYIEASKLYVLPTSIGAVGTTYIDEVELSYYRTPAKPQWTYTLVSGKSIFNASDSSYQDFELPYLFFGKLVTDILMQAGLHLREELVLQATSAEEKNDFNADNS